MKKTNKYKDNEKNNDSFRSRVNKTSEISITITNNSKSNTNRVWHVI
jgi:hypothetical protein